MKRMIFTIGNRLISTNVVKLSSNVRRGYSTTTTTKAKELSSYSYAKMGSLGICELGIFTPIFVCYLSHNRINCQDIYVGDSLKISPRHCVQLADGKDVASKNEETKSSICERRIGLTQSFMDALNHGVVSTLTYPWQSVEETECRRAYFSATEEYMSYFDRSTPPEEAVLRDAHEAAVQKALSIFNASAVRAGSTRQKFEKLLHTFLRKAFEDYKKKLFIEADMQCTKVVQNMEKRLRSACNATDAKLEHVLVFIDKLLSDYEESSYAPGKWLKLASFLHQSLKGPIADLVRKEINQIEAERSSLSLKCRSIEDKMNLLNKQLEANEKIKADYLKRYQNSINEKKKVPYEYMSLVTTLQDGELRENAAKIEQMERHLATLTSELKTTQAKIIEQEKNHPDQYYYSEFARFDEVQERCKAAEKEVKRATEAADKARSEAADANAKTTYLEAQVKEREKKIASLMKSNNGQIDDNVQVLERLLATERAARAKANRRAEALSHQLQATQEKLDMVQQELTSVQLNTSALDANLQTHRKRSRVNEHDDMPIDSDLNERVERRKRRYKRQKKEE